MTSSATAREEQGEVPGDGPSGAGPVLRIEFFHDVLCAFCYALSPRLRRLVADDPTIQIVHRSFALAATPAHLVGMFGSPTAAKEQILGHWRVANANDDEHRMRPELMASRPFPYPHSLPGLLACEAARRQAGEAGYWDMLDQVQRAHLTDCRDIVDPVTLRDCADAAGLDVPRWEADVASESTRRAVDADIAAAAAYGITGVPFLVAQGAYGLSGAVPYEQVQAWVDAVRARVGQGS